MTSESKDRSNVRLSLEKPYNDPNGVPLKKVLDISNEEEFIYEQPKTIDEQLGTRLQRVFDERGNAIWDEYSALWGDDIPDAQEASDENEEEDEDEESEDDDSYNVKKKPMTVEELNKLRIETVPTLMQALNELMISRDVLGVYLKTALPTAPPEGITPELLNVLPPNSLASTTVSRQPPIQSMQAFNLQLSVGGKDEALRKSATAFKTASQSMRRALASGERYWRDALKARNDNWALVPAPLPFGAMTRRSADSNAMDLCISYGLEHSALNNRLSCVVWLNTEDGKGPIAQGARKPTRLCVSVVSTEPDGRKRTSRSTFVPKFVTKEDERVEDVLEDLQREAVEEEILRELMSNAGTLSSAPVWVREETVLVNISASLTLKFERVKEVELEPSPLPDSDPATNAICDVVYHALRLVLLRLHAYNTEIRNILTSRSGRPTRPLLLHAVVELFQYYLFVTKLEKHLKIVVRGLESAGVRVSLRINRLGDTVEELISLLATNYNVDDVKKRPIGGEVLLRIAQRQTLRFTLQVPSILVADLSQSILTIHSMSQLDELLQHEVNRCVLQHFFDIGQANSTGQARESWFVDVVAATCFGSSDGTMIRFKLINRANWKVGCTVEIAERGKAVVHKMYESGDSSLFEWAEGIIKDAIDV